MDKITKIRNEIQKLLKEGNEPDNNVIAEVQFQIKLIKEKLN